VGAGEPRGQGIEGEQAAQPRLVGGPRQLAVVEEVGEVQESSYRGGDRDAVVRRDVGAREGARPVQPDPRVASARRRGDVDGRAVPPVDVPQRGGRQVARDGLRPAGEHRGHHAGEGGWRAVANGVDAAVQAVQAADPEPVGDPLRIEEAVPQQLIARDHSVLAAGEPRDHGVDRLAHWGCDGLS
jgi:hypothetical protein